MVVPDGEACCDALGEAAEMAANALPDRLQGLEAGGSERGMEADALGRAVVDGDEHRGLTLAGDGRGQVGTPHYVHRLGDEGAVVAAWSTRRAHPCGGEQIVLAHQAQHP